MSLKLWFQGTGGLTTAAIVLGDHSVDDGRHYVTPKAIGIVEFEGYVEKLHTDLEEIRQQARQQFASTPRRSLFSN